MLIPKTKTIDGYQIITGLTQLIADPEATKAASVLPLSQIPEAQQLHLKSKEKAGHLKNAGVAGKRAMEADRQAGIEAKKPIRDSDNPQHKLMRSDEFQNPERLKKCEKDYDLYEKERKDRLGAARLCNSELITLSSVVDCKHKDIKRANPIYNHPGVGVLIDPGTKICGWIDEYTDEQGEVVPGCHAIMEDSELTDVLVPDGQTVEGLISAWMSKGENQACGVDGVYIDDYRGKKYWYQDQSGVWFSTEFPYLDNRPEAGEILDADLTDEQRAEINEQQETERVAGLSAEDKAAEFTARDEGLLGQAVVMRSGLEIQGATIAAAKTQATAWYDSAVAELKIKYGVE